jgi:putative endonuclease
MATAYRVYVLQNPKGRRYVGLSENPQQRLHQHNSGMSKWTKLHRPWKIIWQSETLSLSQARKLENQLKRQGGGRGFYSITQLPNLTTHNPAAAGPRSSNPAPQPNPLWMATAYRVYVLQNREDRFYIGLTEDVGEGSTSIIPADHVGQRKRTLGSPLAK